MPLLRTPLNPSLNVKVHMALVSLILSLCTAFRPKIRILIDLFLLFAHDNSTKIYGPLSFILSLCTTIRPKIRVLIGSFLLYVHDYSNKVRGHSYPLIYYFLNCVNISFAIFMAFIFLLLFFW